jgi:membrane-bound ClpP family serine protease
MSQKHSPSWKTGLVLFIIGAVLLIMSWQVGIRDFPIGVIVIGTIIPFLLGIGLAFIGFTIFLAEMKMRLFRKKEGDKP